MQVAGAWVFRDVDDELAFVVANVGFALSDRGSCTETPLSSSCVDNFPIFIVDTGIFVHRGRPITATVYKELKIIDLFPN